jgi:hypothetical protein
MLPDSAPSNSCAEPEFVTAYAVGKITQAEAMDRMSRYELRWGDSPIPAVTTNSKMADEEIVRLMDEKW